MIVLAGCQDDYSEEMSVEEFMDYEELEYFTAVIGNSEFTVDDPEFIRGEIVKGPDEEYNILSFWAFRGELNSKLEPYEELLAFLCYYVGPGTYTTGVKYNQNFCQYWKDSLAWSSDEDIGETGDVHISKASDKFVEGTFRFRAYNKDKPNQSIVIYGEFGVAIDKINP
ncbi:DUF6252 family protein [Christiangramia salexigens]|uniref:Uncharacterized protein n=1 Tax=Christiangramia salexigens TaxID=1913577 RepID=A0A1L3J732_9FLAO|nr:DUF6252 family protein [Christiangramia salexigens]APG60946.1 hypothetical protein LPB144_11230 [Christiangramia salexigens]